MIPHFNVMVQILLFASCLKNQLKFSLIPTTQLVQLSRLDCFIFLRNILSSFRERRGTLNYSSSVYLSHSVSGVNACQYLPDFKNKQRFTVVLILDGPQEISKVQGNFPQWLLKLPREIIYVKFPNSMFSLSGHEKHEKLWFVRTNMNCHEKVMILANFTRSHEKSSYFP